jgi:hypothetical protein
MRQLAAVVAGCSATVPSGSFDRSATVPSAPSGRTWPGPVDNLAEIATEVTTSALKCSEWR